MLPSYYDMTCTPVSFPPILDISYVFFFVSLPSNYGYERNQDLHANEGSSKPIKSLSSFFMALFTYTFSLQLPRCKKWLREGCVEHFDKIDCAAAVSFCNDYLEGPFFTTSEFLYHKPFSFSTVFLMN